MTFLWALKSFLLFHSHQKIITPQKGSTEETSEMTIVKICGLWSGSYPPGGLMCTTWHFVVNWPFWLGCGTKTTCLVLGIYMHTCVELQVIIRWQIVRVIHWWLIRFGSSLLAVRCLQGYLGQMSSRVYMNAKMVDFQKKTVTRSSMLFTVSIFWLIIYAVLLFPLLDQCLSGYFYFSVFLHWF